MGQKSVVVIGGGAAGLMAALAASRQGAQVTLLEQNPRVGKKLLATGNGRCNYTNINLTPDHFHGSDPAFVKTVLDRFPGPQTLE
ncbi:MAG: FAD-dependent oxidoreductase, partial [Firmicutes bacterium]|nr:FAD-dependent oxidoreductase [Bacillota bacterium]